MLGFRKYLTNLMSQFEWWIWHWLRLVDSLVGILSFGYLFTMWDTKWISYCACKRNNYDQASSKKMD